MVLAPLTVLPNISLQHKSGAVNQVADTYPVLQLMLLSKMGGVGSMMQMIKDTQREGPSAVTADGLFETEYLT